MALGGALDPALEGARGGSLQLRRRFSSTGADAKELDPAIEEARRQAAEAKARAKAEKEAKVARENAAMKAKLASTGAKSEHFLT